MYLRASPLRLIFLEIRRSQPSRPDVAIPRATGTLAGKYLEVRAYRVIEQVAGNENLALLFQLPSQYICTITNNK